MSKKKNNEQSIFIWATVALVIIGAIYLITSSSNDAPIVLPDETIEGEWTKGNPDAKVTLVEYGDYQCPACASVHPMVDELVSEFSQHIKFVYRHFPLSIHQHAKIASQAAEAAGVQGKFWEMHDKIYTSQQEWSQSPEADQLFVTYAEELELDVAEFEADMRSDAIVAKVEAALKSADAAHLRGTPSFFLNGEQYSPASYEDFRSTIRSAVENATK